MLPGRSAPASLPRTPPSDTKVSTTAAASSSVRWMRTVLLLRLYMFVFSVAKVSYETKFVACIITHRPRAQVRHTPSGSRGALLCIDDVVWARSHPGVCNPRRVCDACDCTCPHHYHHPPPHPSYPCSSHPRRNPTDSSIQPKNNIFCSAFFPPQQSPPPFPLSPKCPQLPHATAKHPPPPPHPHHLTLAEARVDSLSIECQSQRTK